MANAVILFHNMKAQTKVDIEVPLTITADEFVAAINQAYHLGMDLETPGKAYLQMEYPVALLNGEETLEQLGMRTGSVVFFKG